MYGILEMTGQEAVVAYLMILYPHFIGQTKKKWVREAVCQQPSSE
jgi:hypothetical protein